jgi:hypothetical protein
VISNLSLKIDHVTIAGSSLKKLEDEFGKRLGMKPDYGGPHSNGITHMSLLSFEDGSYIELISVIRPGPSPIWPKFIAHDGGPCAWAVGVDNISEEIERIRKLGLSATGPEDYSRRRPDGALVEWQLGFIGDKPPGATLPFLIKDKTPRELRVKPSGGSSQKGNSNNSIPQGVKKVVLGVNEMEKEIGIFRKVYGWGAPRKSDDLLEGTVIAEFENTPVILATPKGDGKQSWLRDRLLRFGDSPCRFLVGTNNMKEAVKKYGLVNEQDWFGNKVAWIPPAGPFGTVLGFIQSR